MKLVPVQRQKTARLFSWYTVPPAVYTDVIAKSLCFKHLLAE